MVYKIRLLSPVEPWGYRSCIFRYNSRPGLLGRPVKRAFRACPPSAISAEGRSPFKLLLASQPTGERPAPVQGGHLSSRHCSGRSEGNSWQYRRYDSTSVRPPKLLSAPPWVRTTARPAAVSSDTQAKCEFRVTRR